MLHQCPPKENLLAFHRGALAESEVEAVGEHLETCTECEALLQHFEASEDPLLAALRLSSTIGRSASALPRSGQATPDPTLPENWPTLPGYDILGVLGRGGMGVIYQARQQRLNRLVALKRLVYANDRQLLRARREAEALARLQHPNIVQIFEIVECDGRIHLALELVEGGPLSARLKGQPQAPEASAQLIETLARAIHYAHQRGIIHRDLKPSNVLLADGASRHFPSGDTNYPSANPDLPSSAAWSKCIPKITDFGIAKQLSSEDGATRDGDVIGTPSYMAPEQAGGESSTTGPAADVYGLGVLLYEMLTGRVPLQDTNVIDTLLRVRNEEPLPPRRLQPRVPRDLDTICLKCLRKEPGQRYVAAEELADDLQRFLSHRPIRAQPTPSWERAFKWLRRNPGVAALALSLPLTVVLGFSLIFWQWRRAENHATAEIEAKHRAQEDEAREKEARLQLQRLVARNALSEGMSLCENGETARGLLWMAHALVLAEADGDNDLARAARLNLAAWQPYLVRLQAELPQHGWVWNVAFGPDGSMATTGAQDKTACLWDREGKPRGKPLLHRYPVWHAALSPDGKSLLTGSGGDGSEACLWDVATGRLLASWPHANQVLAIAFHPTGRTCLTLSVDAAVLRSVPDGKRVGRTIEHPRPPQALPGFPTPLIGGFSPDGKLVFTAGEDGTIRFWDAATGEPQGKTLRAGAPILAAAFSPDSRTLLIGCIDGKARLWDVAGGLPRSPLLVHRGQVRAVAFSPDGTLAATAGAIDEVNFQTRTIAVGGGEVHLWRASSGDAVTAPWPHPKPVWSLAFSPKGQRLLTGCEDGVARLFLVANGELIAKMPSSSGTVTQVAFDGDGTRCLISAAGGGSTNYARLWRVAPEDRFPRMLLHGNDVDVLKFGSDGRSLLTAGDDRTVRFWDVATGKSQGTPLPQPHRLTLAVIGPDDRSLFASCEWNEETKERPGRQWHSAFWDLTARKKRLDLHLPQRPFCAAFCDEGRALLVGDIEGNLQLYEVATGKPLGSSLKQNGSVHSLEFSSDKQTVVTGEDGGAVLWDWRTRRLFERVSFGKSAAIARFYPDGNRLLLIQKGFAHVWDRAANERKAPPLFQADGNINDLDFSSDTRSVLICDNEGRARLWDVSTGKRIGPASALKDGNRIAFSPNGRDFAVAGKYGRIVLGQTPLPMQGSAERLRLWAETLAGVELDAQQIIRSLDPDELRRRRSRLDEWGGPPE